MPDPNVHLFQCRIVLRIEVGKILLEDVGDRCSSLENLPLDLLKLS